MIIVKSLDIDDHCFLVGNIISMFHTLPTFFIVYMVCWGAACFVAIAMMFFRAKDIDLFSEHYKNYLLAPWKIVTFGISAAGLILIAPYTGDVTWDYYDAAMMAVLTFITAPWSVGTLFKVLVKQRALWQGYVAICLWLFSASWCYDLYLWIRDGYYPVTWFANIFASSILYISAGLLWNLAYVPGRGVIFGFMDKSWPDMNVQTSLKNVFIFALPFMLIAGVAIISFVF